MHVRANHTCSRASRDFTVIPLPLPPHATLLRRRLPHFSPSSFSVEASDPLHPPTSTPSLFPHPWSPCRAYDGGGRRGKSISTAGRSGAESRGWEGRGSPTEGIAPEGGAGQIRKLTPLPRRLKSQQTFSSLRTGLEGIMYLCWRNTPANFAEFNQTTGLAARSGGKIDL